MVFNLLVTWLLTIVKSILRPPVTFRQCPIYTPPVTFRRSVKHSLIQGQSPWRFHFHVNSVRPISSDGSHFPSPLTPHGPAVYSAAEDLVARPPDPTGVVAPAALRRGLAVLSQPPGGACCGVVPATGCRSGAAWWDARDLVYGARDLRVVGLQEVPFGVYRKKKLATVSPLFLLSPSCPPVVLLECSCCPLAMLTLSSFVLAVSSCCPLAASHACERCQRCCGSCVVLLQAFSGSAWPPRRFSFLHLVRVCLCVTMNATVVQRFKFDTILGYSHDIYHCLLHVSVFFQWIRMPTMDFMGSIQQHPATIVLLKVLKRLHGKGKSFLFSIYSAVLLGRLGSSRWKKWRGRAVRHGV